MTKLLLPIIMALTVPLQAQMSTNRGISKAQANATYLKLDASNDPVTGALEVTTMTIAGGDGVIYSTFNADGSAVFGGDVDAVGVLAAGSVASDAGVSGTNGEFSGWIQAATGTITGSNFSVGITTLVVTGSSVSIGGLPGTYKFSAFPDTDTTMVVGRTKIGYDTFSDVAWFSHVDQSGQGYAASQTSGGTTNINAKTGVNLNLNINSVPKMVISGTTGNVGVGAGSNPACYFTVDSTFCVKSNGNVGIMTTAPGSPLHVEGASHFAGTATITGNAFSVGTSTLVVYEGNVGIGTASPGAKLEVNGNITASSITATTAEGFAAIRTSSGLYVGGRTGMGTEPSSDYMLHINKPRNLTAYNVPAMFQVSDVQADDRVMIPFGHSYTSGNMGYIELQWYGSNHADNAIRLGFHSNDDLLNIKKNGNVGIGTTSPGSVLEVNGGVHASSYTASGYEFAVRTSSTVTTATDACVAGSMRWDPGFLYLCTAANTWERVAVAGW